MSVYEGCNATITMLLEDLGLDSILQTVTCEIEVADHGGWHENDEEGVRWQDHAPGAEPHQQILTPEERYRMALEVIAKGSWNVNRGRTCTVNNYAQHVLDGGRP